MPYLILGALGFWIALALAKAFARANPASLVRLLKRSGGFLSLSLAFGLLLLGRFGLALSLGAFGLWLLGISASPMPWFKPAGGQTANQSSRVSSPMVEMELDHESGLMRGRILAGSYAGKSLEDLTRPECLAVYQVCLIDDPDGARLLEAYLDRRFPGWGVADDRDADSRSASRHAGPMSENEAYEVLGLEKGAPREAIIRAHHTLMKKLHPDLGGSTDLAARVNEAKDVLMRRHV